MNRAAALLRSATEPRPDGELLDAFRVHRDEAAFAELVRRHGPLVWAACRRLLPDHPDAEDAFQATFLVLVRRAKSLCGSSTLAPWLYKVAVWTARNLRRKNARRLARTVPLAETPSPISDPDSRLDLDAALLSLSEKYRSPLILCHLQGLSRRDAARQLGVPEGTLSSLLARGLAKLRVKLDTPPIAAVPALLAASTVRAATATQLAVSASVADLTEGVLRMFWVKKATAAVVVLAVVFGTGIGFGVAVRTTPHATADEKPAVKATPQTSEELAALKARFIEETLKLRTAELKVAHTEKMVAAMKPAVGTGIKAPTKVEYLQALITLTRLQEELALTQAQYRALRARIELLEGGKPDDQSVIDLTIGGKELGYPLHINEHDKDGKMVGGVKIEPQAMLVRYLTRARLDPTAPKKLRIVSWTDAPHDHIKATLRSCQEAGFKEAIFHGRMPTDDPEIRFTPPPKDPGGKRDGWFEADEVTIKFDELLKPPVKR